MSEYNNFQIPHVGVDSSTKGPAVQNRDIHMRMSNFGALNFGNRMSTDYTRTDLEFDSKIENQRTIEFEIEALQNENPLIAGSTVKYTRDDQFLRMGMANNETGANITTPGKDVMDTQAVRSGMVSGKNYPSEGWRSFGGKYDFAKAYDGMVH